MLMPATLTQNRAMVDEYTDRQLSSIDAVDDMYHRIVVEKAVTLASHTYTPILLATTGAKTLLF